MSKNNKTHDYFENEDYYDISSPRSQKKSRSRKKRRNTKDMLRDFTDARNGRSTFDDVEDLNDWYGDSLEKDW